LAIKGLLYCTITPTKAPVNVSISVPDTLHFGTDPDPVPRVRTSDGSGSEPKSSVTFRMHKKSIFSYVLIN
jgi:hypothetical protein